MPGFSSGGSARVSTLIERQLRHWDRLAAALKKPLGPEPLAEATHRPVLTVSGFCGSGRERLALALCKQFEYELYGREILDAVASDLHCQRKLLESLDEKVQSNIRLMLESWIHGRQIENQEYVRSLFRVVTVLATKGGAVILGRGGAFILGEKAGLRIRLEAPLGLRIRRVAESRKISEKEARQYIEARDQDQRKSVSRHFRRDIDDPLAYDLTINTERVEPEAAVGAVRAALGARGIEIHKPAV